MENNYRSIAQVDENQAYGNSTENRPLDDKDRELRQLSHSRFNSCRYDLFLILTACLRDLWATKLVTFSNNYLAFVTLTHDKKK